jgi:FkbM family methyltransferase
MAPNIDEIVNVYEEAYEIWKTNKSRWHAFTTQARQSAKRYDIDRVWKRYWRPALDAIFKGRSVIFENAGLKWKVDIDVTSGDGIGPQHEDSVEQVLLSLIPRGGVFLDVGAHVGHYSLRASKIAKEVLAVEAHPETAKRLRENIALNEIYNITVYEIAAWDEGISLSMVSPNDSVRDGSMRIVDEVDSAQNRTAWIVQGRPLDIPLRNVTRIDVIKLDVEGADLHALRGMRELIAKHRPVMFIEDHSIYDYYKKEDLAQLITDLGYSWIDGGTYGGANYLICRPL